MVLQFKTFFMLLSLPLFYCLKIIKRITEMNKIDATFKIFLRNDRSQHNLLYILQRKESFNTYFFTQCCSFSLGHVTSL